MDDDMKLSANTVKRLRHDRAWSQEQLAEVADVSLRTIQRVESDGNASLETRKALAAAFTVDVRTLAEPEVGQPALAAALSAMPSSSPAAPPIPLAGSQRIYYATLVAAVLAAAGSAGSAITGWSDDIATIALMVAIAAAMFGGFGWYGGQAAAAAPATPARKTVRFGFVMGAIALLFAGFSAAPREMATMSLQMVALASTLYFVFQRYQTRSDGKTD